MGRAAGRPEEDLCSHPCGMRPDLSLLLGALCAVPWRQACGAHGRGRNSRQCRAVAAFVPGQPPGRSSAQAVCCCIQKHNEWELSI